MGRPRRVGGKEEDEDRSVAAVGSLVEMTDASTVTQTVAHLPTKSTNATQVLYMKTYKAEHQTYMPYLRIVQSAAKYTPVELSCRHANLDLDFNLGRDAIFGSITLPCCLLKEEESTFHCQQRLCSSTGLAHWHLSSFGIANPFLTGCSSTTRGLLRRGARDKKGNEWASG
jgi:hypothetical protein